MQGWENWEAATRDDQVPIYTFWHNRVFLSTYFWQKRRIVVMTSQSFDGEYIARFIQRFGYGAARGSSTRGAVGAIIEMTRLMRAGLSTAFTIDGPKGPRYVAKMGAVLLAKRLASRSCPSRLRRSTFGRRNGVGTAFRFPCHFHALVLDIAPPIYVSADTNDDGLEAKRDELQAALDEINARFGKDHRDVNQPRADIR